MAAFKRDGVSFTQPFVLVYIENDVDIAAAKLRCKANNEYLFAEPISHIYRPRSSGNNTFGRVSVLACTFVCGHCSV